jgi:hypothetical protein
MLTYALNYVIKVEDPSEEDTVVLYSTLQYLQYSTLLLRWRTLLRRTLWSSIVRNNTCNTKL